MNVYSATLTCEQGSAIPHLPYDLWLLSIGITCMTGETKILFQIFHILAIHPSPGDSNLQHVAYNTIRWKMRITTITSFCKSLREVTHINNDDVFSRPVVEGQ